MSGHSKWSQIKHKKAAIDQKRGRLFSKLSKIISVTAKKGTDPSRNPELKNVIEQARSFNMPNDNIERAIKRAQEKSAASFEELQIEAMGPENSGFVIQAITGNKNRTISEIKSLFKEYGVNMVHPGTLSWVFDRKGITFIPKISVKIESPKVELKLKEFLHKINEHEDVNKIYTNIKEQE